MLNQRPDDRPPAVSAPAASLITARPKVGFRRPSPLIRRPLPDGQFWDPDEQEDDAAGRNRPPVPSPFALVTRLDQHLSSSSREPTLFRFAAAELNESNLPTLIDHIDFTTTARQHVKKDVPSERTIAVAASKRKLSTSIRLHGKVRGDKCRKCKANGIECVRAEKGDGHGTDKCAHCVSVGKPCVLPEVFTPRTWQHQRDPLSVLEAALAPPLPVAEQENGRYTHGVWVLGGQSGPCIQHYKDDGESNERNHKDDDESDEQNTIVVLREDFTRSRQQTEGHSKRDTRVFDGMHIAPDARHIPWTPPDLYRSRGGPVDRESPAAGERQGDSVVGVRGITKPPGQGAAEAGRGDLEVSAQGWGLDVLDRPDELGVPDRSTHHFASRATTGVRPTVPATPTTSRDSEAQPKRKSIAVEEEAKGKTDVTVTSVGRRTRGRADEDVDEEDEERREFARRRALMDDLWMPKLSSYQSDDDDDDDDDTSLDGLDRDMSK